MNEHLNPTNENFSNEELDVEKKLHTARNKGLKALTSLLQIQE